MAKVERVAVPLVMLPGNMEVLLKRPVNVSRISLTPYTGSGELPEGLDPGEDAVVLVFHFGEGEQGMARSAGMQFDVEAE